MIKKIEMCLYTVALVFCLLACGQDLLTYNVTVKSDQASTQMEIWQTCGGVLVSFNSLVNTDQVIFVGKMDHDQMNCYQQHGTFIWLAELE